MAAAACASTLLLAGCIKNDLPYPRIQANFTEFTVEQMLRSVIDTTAMTVTLQMEEEADLRAVRVLSYEVAPEGVTLAPGHSVPTTLNLTEPWSVDLHLYQTYTWTVTAVQDIERYFTVDGQIGASVIDVPQHRVVVYVPEAADLGALRVTSAKLGAKGSVCEPELSGRTLSFIDPVEVTVTTHGEAQVWTIYVEHSEQNVILSAADAWSRVAWLYADAPADAEGGFEYREAGSEEWLPVPAEWVSASGGSLTARVVHLKPLTEYEARAYAGEEYTPAVTFVTQGEAQLPNSNFNQWWLDGKVWNPWAEGDDAFWGTGNPGATTLGPSITTPLDEADTSAGGASLLTKFVGVMGVGKLAAGNIFSGLYFATDGTNGILKFGREWDLRPTRLTGSFTYKSAPISSVGTDAQFQDWKNRPDTANIYILLADWAEPFEVRTNPRNRQLIDFNAPEVIAVGAVQYGESHEEWSKFSIELDYRSTSRVPRYVLVVASASKYGDYFVGGDGSLLCIDKLKLEYDY